MGAAAARCVLPSLSGDGGVWDLPAKVLEAQVCLVVMGNAKCLGRGGPAVPWSQRGELQAFRQCLQCLWVGVTCSSV